MQKWISKSDQLEIERRVLELEQKYPLEIVVAFTEKPAPVPFAAARMIALLAIVIELFAEFFWLPIPAWALGLGVFLALLLPAASWHDFWLFRIARFNSERRQGVLQQAEQCFSELGLARTKARNALLVFFNLKERIFLLRPDGTLASEWPALKMGELVELLEQQMQSESSAPAASLQLLKKLSELAPKRWPDAQLMPPANELPNGVVWWQN